MIEEEGEGRTTPRDRSWWKSQILRPAFIRFAIEIGLEGYGPVVTQSMLGCRVEVRLRNGPSETYLGCLELADADSDELDVAIPEISWNFEGRTRSEIGEDEIFSALRVSFDRWLAQRNVPAVSLLPEDTDENPGAGGT